jgi:hypothetical protein
MAARKKTNLKFNLRRSLCLCGQRTMTPRVMSITARQGTTKSAAHVAVPQRRFAPCGIPPLLSTLAPLIRVDPAFPHP